MKTFYRVEDKVFDDIKEAEKYEKDLAKKKEEAEILQKEKTKRYEEIKAKEDELDKLYTEFEKDYKGWIKPKTYYVNGIRYNNFDYLLDNLLKF